MRAASASYLASFRVSQPGSWGRLIGAVKAAVLAGDGTAAATAATDALGDMADTPPACYLGALCALVLGDHDRARRLTPGMRPGGPAFARAADGIDAIAGSNGPALEQAVTAIEHDFAQRSAHLTGVPIADTAEMLIGLSAHTKFR